LIERVHVSGTSHVAARLRPRTTTTWHDGDLLWLGLLLSVLSAALVIALLWWLFT
jgi:hypothetical protein